MNTMKTRRIAGRTIASVNSFRVLYIPDRVIVDNYIAFHFVRIT